MARYTDESKERVRDAVDFPELVAARTGDLRRSGPTGFVGLCPFHDERTPSFSVEGSKKLFHCFGCGEQGDVFTYVQKTEGLDFGGALEFLADRTGVKLELEAEDPQAAERRRRRERLLELLERTAAFYVRVLWESAEAARARDYLAGRGLTEATLREFRVGYAPSAWDTVLLNSQRAGFRPTELWAAGLVVRGQKGEGNVYDRFRGRITFPLADTRGRVLGFGARAMRDNQGAKYLNTAENDLFHKGRMVYGADLARAHAAKAGSVILCEGYTDVLALHQAGLRNAVATMGTALTEDQVVELGRMASTVQMALDADAAGQEAMLRAARVAAGRKLELRVVPLPPGRDPADVVTGEGADAMRALVERSVAFVRFRVDRALATGDTASAEGKDLVLAELRPVFAGMEPSVLRDELLRVVADRLDVAPDLVASLLGRGGDGGRARVRRDGRGGAGGGGGAVTRAPGPDDREEEPGRDRAPAVPARTALGRGAQTEREFLLLCVALPDAGATALGSIDVDAHFTDPTGARVAAWLREPGRLAAPLDGLPGDDPELAALVHELVTRAGAREADPAQLEVERWQLELARIERQLARAAEGSSAALAEQRIEVRRRLDLALDRALA